MNGGGGEQLVGIFDLRGFSVTRNADFAFAAFMVSEWSTHDVMARHWSKKSQSPPWYAHAVMMLYVFLCAVPMTAP